LSDEGVLAADAHAWSLISGGGRIAFGLVMLVAPDRSLRALGFAEVSPTTRVVTRLAGIRDLVLGCVTLGAVGDRGRLLSATVANATADAGDSAAFALALKAGQREAAVRGLAAALPATIAGIWVARRLS
jgi:hypothetical protein